MFSSNFSSLLDDDPNLAFTFFYPFCLAATKSSSSFLKNSSLESLEFESHGRWIGDGGGDRGDT